jgi:hypothetical protein
VRNPSAARSRRIVAEIELIGRQLLSDEPVVRLVFVEGVDHVVAIRVGIRIPRLFGEDVALGIRVAGDIEPQPGICSP